MFEALLVMVATVNRITEVVKRELARRGMPESQRKIVVFVVSLIAGIGTVYVADSTGGLFAGTFMARLTPIFAYLIAGAAVALGADFIHLLMDIVKALGTVGEVKTITVPEPTPVAQTATSFGTPQAQTVVVSTRQIPTDNG